MSGVEKDGGAAAMRPETTSEHIARDIREGRFPEQSPVQMVPVEAMTRDTDLIRRALVEMFGERCPDFDPDCVGCQAWAEFDRLTARPEQEPPSPASNTADLLNLIRWAHDTLYEINPSNYDHDEVCRLNDASVEVILGLAPVLGETHGKSPEWWTDHRVGPLPSPGVTAGATGVGVDIAVIAKLRNGLINSLSANGKRVSLDREQTRGLMLVAADRLEAAIARVAELENALDERGKELTAAWHQLGTADLGPLAKAARGMKRIVEEIDGAMNHGTWRDEKGMRLKDTPEWVALYNAINIHPATPAPVVPAEGLDDLLMRFDAMRNRYAVGMLSVSDAGVLSEVWDALRSAPPVGVRVKPLVWREDRDTWVSDCEVGTYRVGFDDGWWCSLEGAESWDWDSPDDPRSYHGPSTAQNAAQADFVARILAALLPAGEGEE